MISITPHFRTYHIAQFFLGYSFFQIQELTAVFGHLDHNRHQLQAEGTQGGNKMKVKQIWGGGGGESYLHACVEKFLA